MAPGDPDPTPPVHLQDTYGAKGQWDGDFDDMKAILNRMSPQGLNACSDSYEAATKLLGTSADTIYNIGWQLADVWKGDASAKMQEKLKQLWQQARELSSNAGMIQNNLFYNQAQTIQTYKDNPPGEDKGNWATDEPVVGLFTDSGDEIKKRNNDRAKKFMNIGTLDNGNDSLGKSTMFDNSGVPETMRVDNPHVDITSNRPDTHKSGSIGGGGGGGGGIGGGGGGGLGGGGGIGGVPHSSPNLTGPDTHAGGIPDHQGADLAGLNPPGTGGGGLQGGLGGGGGGLGGGGLGGGGLGGGGLGGGGLGGGGLGGGGLGGGGLGGGLAGGARGLGSKGGLGGSAAESAEEAAAAERAGMAGMAGKSGAGVGGMPMGMGGGGGGGQKQERERTTWLTEDEDVWGGDDDVAPPVIG